MRLIERVSSGQFADRSGRDVQHAKAAASQGCSESVFTFVCPPSVARLFYDLFSDAALHFAGFQAAALH